MQVRTLFFGMLKDLAGRGSDLLNLPENATLGDVVIHYEKLIPRLEELAASIAISVNQEFAGPDSKLKEGDEIAFLPPVSGGSQGLASDGQPVGRTYSSIVREKINTQAVLAKLKQPSDGAAVVFEGVVRDNTRGRRTLYLDYEAYEEMALKQMDALGRAGIAAVSHPRRRHRAPFRAAGNRRDQRIDRGGVGAPGGRVRRLPLAHRHAQAHRAHLEEGVF